MRRSLVSIGAVLVFAVGITASASAQAKDYAATALNIIPSGQYGALGSPAGLRHPGEDVRRPDAAVRPGHPRRPDHLLQVGALRRRQRHPEHDRGRAAGRRHDRARLLQRPARHRRHPRRRRLGGRLDRRGGPRTAARSRRATTRCVAAIDAPGLNALEPDQRPAELPAQRPDGGRGRQAEPACSRPPGPRARRSCTTSTSSSPGSTTTSPRAARRSRRGRATTCSPSTRSRASSSARAAATRRGARSSSAA